MAKGYNNDDRSNMVQDFVKQARNGGGSFNPTNATTPEDQFINNASEDENRSVIPAADEGDAMFLQNSLNMYNEVISKKTGNAAPEALKVDGIIGPKSKQTVKGVYGSLPPALRKLVGQKLNNIKG